MKIIFTKGANKDSIDIRTKVFIDEQLFKEEFDDYDKFVPTMVIYDHNLPIATGRLYMVDKENKAFKLGRIAVIKQYRGKGIGSLVITELEKKAIKLGAKEFLISAQLRAKKFYETNGYSAYGKTYFEEHVEHIAMKKQI